MRAVAPDAQLAAVIHHWGRYYAAEARAVLDGTWNPRPVWGGMRDGFVELGAIDPRLPPALRQRVEASRQAIVDGRFQPFSAPLTDNAGKVRLARRRARRCRDPAHGLAGRGRRRHAAALN